MSLSFGISTLHRALPSPATMHTHVDTPYTDAHYGASHLDIFFSSPTYVSYWVDSFTGWVLLKSSISPPVRCSYRVSLCRPSPRLDHLIMSSALASLASGLSTDTIASMLSTMSSSQIVSTLESLQTAGVNLSSIDTTAVISKLNITQVTGLLSSNSSTVNGLLQSFTPVQLVSLIDDMSNSTSTLFKTAAATNNIALYKQGRTLVGLLLKKMDTTFTESQLLGVFKILGNGAAFGTGAKVLMDKAKSLVHSFFGGANVDVEIPTRLLNLVEDYQPAIFGSYPDSKDIAPSAIFIAIFAIFTIIYTLLFAKNWARGHKFLITLGLAIYSLIRTLGFILRLVWAKDITRLDVGLTSTIFLVICTVFLPSLNLILAQRYFTWKHPVLGSSKPFMTLMYIIYALVACVVIMTIVAAAVQIDYLLSESHFAMTKKVIRASSVLICLYSLVAVVLVFGASFIPASSNDKDVLTYQPSWISSFSTTYFAPKGAAAQNNAAVPDDKRHAVRVIQSSTYHHTTVHGEQQHEKELHHLGSIIVISFTTFFLFITDIFRCVSTFIDQYNKNHSWIFDPVVMYVMFGALETIVNLMYILGRIDLRFYKPDALEAPVATSTSSVHDDVEKASPSASSNEEVAAVVDEEQNITTEENVANKN
ncbi:CYFA0S02e01860g1_1 [Cyberlindnera fabianii]|uniref:CYFA0S02e01860g1_1 n=2 Tax=Cyberlindnera fabianii TaxID=36022 RepID=A0A061AUU7_CYBFA|nr:CYFA0S02e01860g1_1 [Cyberlindnera fabianii]